MATQQIRLNKSLVEAAELQGALEHRPSPKQIEYWAKLGQAVSKHVSPEDVVALMQGFKRVRLEMANPAHAGMDAVLDSLEADRKSGTLARSVTKAPFSFGIHSETGLPGRYDPSGNLMGKG